MRRVVVTGVGMATPLARTCEETWRLMLEGASGVRPISRFDASKLPVNIAGEAAGFEGDISAGQGLERHAVYGLEAASEAWTMAGLTEGAVDPQQLGVYLGAGDGATPVGPMELGPVFQACRQGDRVDVSGLERAARSHMSLELCRESDPMIPATHLARRFGARGLNRTCLTACAASSQAVGEAFRAVQRGSADVIIAGGCQALITLEGLVGFTLLNALSKRNDSPQEASRPFDQERDGFILSEGAGMLILESLDHARARGATVLAEMAGYGASADAYRVTDPQPEGKGAILCMQRAIGNSGLPVAEFSYVNSHGTSTKANDAAESKAINEVFKGRRLPVTSNKSSVGHLIAAAGAVELITCVLSIRDSVIPPTINYQTPDPACDVDVVGNEARRDQTIHHVISNSFGFGGQNVSLVISRHD